MTKLVNLDQIDTRKSKAVILNGKEHVMRSLTVREYVEQLKASEQINTLVKDTDNEAENLIKIFELSVEALAKVFPTITKEEFDGLDLDQLNALRELVEYDESVEKLKEDETKGEAPGETV